MKTKQEIVDDLGDTLNEIRKLIHEDSTMSDLDVLKVGSETSFQFAFLSVLVDIRDQLVINNRRHKQFINAFMEASK